MRISTLFALLLPLTADSFMAFPKLPFDTEALENYDLTVRKTSSGLVRGKRTVTPEGVEGFAFLSLPIAEAPIGPLRFRAPRSRKPWVGVLNVTEYTVSCFWNSTETSYDPATFVMDEDCLHIHVFTNKHCLEKGGCALGVYVHGGDLAYGTPLQFDNDVLANNFNNASRNVVFVTISFRQALFGVINLNWRLKLSMEMNLAIHDLIHALNWIQTDIHAFGGDPKRLTLMGHSGGATLVKFLAASPKSKHMVSQMITMSPSTDNFLYRDKNQRTSRRLSQHVGCADFDYEDVKWQQIEEVEKVLACLRNRTARELSDGQRVIEPEFEFFSPARDIGPDAVLPDSFDDLHAQIQAIPYMAGTVTKEFLASKTTVVDGVYVDQIELRIWCREALKLGGYPTPTNEVILACMKAYNSTKTSMYVNDDPDVYVPTRVFCEVQAQKGSDVFLYEYSYPGIGAAYASKSPYVEEESPHHAQELVYILGQHKGPFTPKDVQIQYLFLQYFVDFINDGTPSKAGNPWTKLDPKRGNYFNIDFPDPTLESPGMKSDFHKHGYDFWHVFLPTVAGPKYTPHTEIEGFSRGMSHGSMEVAADYGEEPFGYKEEDHSGLNWTITFWVGMGIILLLAVSHVITCCHFKTKKNDYQVI